MEVELLAFEKSAPRAANAGAMAPKELPASMHANRTRSAFGRDKELEILAGSRPRQLVRLPLVAVEWLPDALTVSKVYRRGQFRPGERPPNFGHRYPAEPLTPAETLRVLDGCDTTTPAGIRNRALLVLLWRSGLRISEALALRPHHVDFDQKTVVVLKGKGSKRRTSGIDDWALEQLRPWLACRAELGIPPDAPLFCGVLGGAKGHPLASTYVRQVCKRLAREAGISKRCHPHGFRHGHACDLVREGTGVHLIQRQLGHSNLAVTANYLSGIAPEEVIAVVSARRAPGGEA